MSKDTIDQEFGAALRANRLACGFTQAELAGKIPSANQSTVAKWERGETPMRVRDAVQACNALGISLAELGSAGGKPGSERFQDGVQRGIELSIAALLKVGER